MTPRPRFEALRKFCEYWVDAGRNATCCMAAPQALVDDEPEAFDCDTCEHRRQMDDLDPDNRDAWRFFCRFTAHRWLADFQVMPWFLDQLMTGKDEDARDELLARVSIIYDTLHPPKTDG